MSTELKTLNGYGFDATKLGGLDAQYYAQGRAAHNLLDNSWFVNPVNQRGQTSYTGAGYTIDRWKAGVSDCSMYVKAGESVAFNTKTEGVNAYWRQYLPYSLSQLGGKTFTLAIKDTWGKTHCATGVYPSSAPSDTKSVIWINMYENVSIVLYCTTDGTAFVQLTTKKSVPIVWAALYEGSYTADTLPAYQPKGYAVELAECQRYYENSWFGSDKTKNLEMHGVAYKSTALDVWVKYRVPKRIVATVTLYPVEDTDGWRIYKGQAYRNLDSVSARYKYHDGFILNAIKGSEDTTTWTDGEAMLVYGHWEASADL